jgi:hypothetical protein
MFAERNDIVVRTEFSAAACFEFVEPVESWILAGSSDTVVETGIAVAADSRMARHAVLPESVGASDTLAKPETSAVPGSSSGFDLMRLDTVAKIDIAVQVKPDCAEPEATHSDILDPGCALHSGSRNDLH